MKKSILIFVVICLIPSFCLASWDAYITGARQKYLPNDTIPTTTSLTVNAVKGQFAAWQILCKIDGEDVSTINATATTPAKGGDSLTAPLIYKAYLHNIPIPSRRNNLGGLGTDLGNPIGEHPDALIPKVDAYYGETRNAFPFNINRISPVYEFPSVTISGGASSSITLLNTARTLPTIGGTYSGSGLKNYHIIVDGAGAKGVATFKWSSTAFNIKVAAWNLATTTATITTYQNHGFTTGDTVRIKTSRATFNGEYTITVVSATVFTYSVSGVYSSNLYYDGGGTAIKTYGGTTVTTGDAVALDNGLTITFPVQTYAVGDEWEFYVNTSRVETLWMESYIPTNAVAGNYTSTITITAGGKADVTLNLTITVYNITGIGKEPTIPIRYYAQKDHPVRGHFQTQWNSDADATHVALLRRYTEGGLRHRMTIDSMAPARTWAADNLSITNWDSGTNVKAFLALYLDGTWTQGAEPTGIKWSAYVCTLPTILLFQSSVVASDYTATEKTRLTTFASLFDAEGWMTIHKPAIIVSEEPTGTGFPTTAQTTAVQNGYNSMKAISSNYRALHTKRYVSAWADYTDVWVPGVLSLDPAGSYPRSAYNAAIAAGDALMSYVACDGKGCGIVGSSGYDGNVTYSIDSTLTDIIGYFWMMYDNDVRGDLYYNAIEGQSYYYNSDATKVQDFWDFPYGYGGSGEGTFFYPGRVTGAHAIGGTNDIPIESMRLKAWRMGQEDYEIFKLTSRSANSLAQVQSAAGTGKYKYTAGLPSGSIMETSRTNILDELLGQPPAIVPTVTTTAVTSITTTTASSGGNVTYNGGGTVSARGVCWNTAGNPTTSDSKTTDGSGTGAFTSSITGLSPGNTYYVRAYATNEVGTSYGTQLIFNSIGVIGITIGTGSTTITIGTGTSTITW